MNYNFVIEIRNARKNFTQYSEGVETDYER